jgi:hypothetical protein
MFRKAYALLGSLALGGVLLAPAAAGQGFGAIETPTAGQTVSGVVQVAGWASDFKQVSKVELYVDGILTNRADTNLPRPDILSQYPAFALGPNQNPGFLTSFLGRLYSNGTHSVSILVTESDQSTFTLGPVTVLLDNTINQPPFGWIDVPGPQGFPGASGSVGIVGWALDDVAVDHIDFLIDSQIVATAIGHNLPGSTASYGSQRAEVRAAYPDVPGSLYSGFGANIDTTRLINGVHTLDVRATDNLGASALIGSRPLQIVNNPGNIGPFGWLDFPLDKASLLCSTGSGGGSPSPPAPPGAIFNYVSGWALSTGTQPGKGSVVWVELRLDGAVVSNTARDCFQSGGKLYDCYGLSRPDVPRVFPGYENGDNGGFRFAVAFLPDFALPGLFDVALPQADGSLAITTFTVAGKHTLAVYAGSDEGVAKQIASISVDILCDASGGNQPAFGYIDSPQGGQEVVGNLSVFGWAYDIQGVDHIEVDIDGQLFATSANATAVYGLLRPDVPAHDPRVPGPGNVGWQTAIDTTKVGDGQHEIEVYVIDRSLQTSEIGRQRFTVNNNSLTHQ